MNDYDYRFETKRVVFVIDTKSFLCFCRSRGPWFAPNESAVSRGIKRP